MMSNLVIRLLAGAFALLVAVSAAPTTPAQRVHNNNSDRKQKCISGTAQGVCKIQSNCKWPNEASEAKTSSDYGCKNGMVCCTKKTENQLCQSLSSVTPLPNPADGCCGIERSFVAASTGNSSLDEDDRILNGTKSGLYQSPWLVRILHHGKHLASKSACSGVLVGARYVLSVKHCLNKDVKGVLLGCAVNSDKCVLEKKVWRNEPHDDMDFVILKLEEAVPYTDLIRPICLPTEVVPRGVELLVSGWGRTLANDSHSVSVDKLYSHVPHVPRNDCNRMLQEHNIDDPVQAGYTCAGGDDTGRDACQGDSGGPLEREVGERHDLAGLVRGYMTTGDGVTCGRRGVPTKYVDVFALRDWIYSTISDMEAD